MEKPKPPQLVVGNEELNEFLNENLTQARLKRAFGALKEIFSTDEEFETYYDSENVDVEGLRYPLNPVLLINSPEYSFVRVFYFSKATSPDSGDEVDITGLECKLAHIDPGCYTVRTFTLISRPGKSYIIGKCSDITYRQSDMEIIDSLESDIHHEQAKWIKELVSQPVVI